MFRLSRPLLFFDYFRIPYELSVEPPASSRELPERHPLRSAGEARWTDGESPPRSLRWPVFSDAYGHNGDVRPGLLGAIPVFGRMLGDDEAQAWLVETGGSWSPTIPVTDGDGRRIASVWRSTGGDVLLPFDPSEVIENYWSERYQLVTGRMARGAKDVARRAYYRARPLLPRQGQILLRRAFTKVQRRSSFPRWPVEPALHELYDLLFELTASVARAPVPFLGVWPDGCSWALVLSHDVETEVGYRNLHLLRGLEAERGYRSGWNFVPLRYAVSDQVVAELLGDGFEVGVHGLYHDGRDLESLKTLQERIPAMRDYARRWGAPGFRAPATHRNWNWMPLLGFDYDSSYPDTDPYEPQAGGCCTWLPFFNQDLVELPITLPQDHTLFRILRKPDESLWWEKTSLLRRRGGMALLLTHPDYMLEPRRLEGYARFLDQYADDPTAWRVLPGDVARWWRRRAESRVVDVHGRWEIEGPAAFDGRIAFHEAKHPDSGRMSSVGAGSVPLNCAR